MILSDGEIRDELASGELVIDDMKDPELQIQPSSVDLRLGNEYRHYREDVAVVDPIRDDHEALTEKVGPVDEIVLQPDDFILVPTFERVYIPDDLQGSITGRSSFGRCGVEVHSTAGLCDPDWEGNIVLEISNNLKRPINLTPGSRVCQLVLKRLGRSADVGYAERQDSKYDGQRGPEPSRALDDP